MTQVRVSIQNLTDIADAIREKLGTSSTFKPSEMSGAILDINGSGSATDRILAGTSTPTSEDGSDGCVYMLYELESISLPTGTTLLEYIESHDEDIKQQTESNSESEGLQFIDTLIPCNTQDLLIEIEFKAVYHPYRNSAQILFGGDDTVSGFSIIYTFSENDKLSLNVMTKGLSYRVNAESAYGYHVVELHDSGTIAIDGGFPKEEDQTGTNSNSTLKLFGGYVDGTTHHAKGALARIRRVRVWSGETLLMHLVPVKDANDVVCMYDVVSQQHYMNSGTGAFSAGPESPVIAKVTAFYIKEAGGWYTIPYAVAPIWNGADSSTPQLNE